MSTDVVVYCNGDSFCNGTELGDIHITSHPGFYDFEQVGKDVEFSNRKWYRDSIDENHRLGQERNLKRALIQAEEERCAFPSLLQKKLDVKLINKSLKTLGNSQSSITRNTIIDLHHLAKNYKKVIAVICNTSINRLEVPNTLQWNNLMLGNIPNASNHYEEMLQGLAKFYNYYGTDYHLYTEWYKNIILIKLFCEQQGIKLYWTTGMPYDNIELHGKDDLLSLVNIANFRYDVHMYDVAKQIGKEVWCPGSHFSPLVHQKVAELFADLIRQEL